MGMPPNKDEREALAKVGVEVPRDTYAAGSGGGKNYGFDWEDLGAFHTMGKCPWCKGDIEISDDTDEDIDCASCGKALRVELESADIEFSLRISPTITETDRRYLQARKTT